MTQDHKNASLSLVSNVFPCYQFSPRSAAPAYYRHRHAAYTRLRRHDNNNNNSGDTSPMRVAEHTPTQTYTNTSLVIWGCRIYGLRVNEPTLRVSAHGSVDKTQAILKTTGTASSPLNRCTMIWVATGETWWAYIIHLPLLEL